MIAQFINFVNCGSNRSIAGKFGNLGSLDNISDVSSLADEDSFAPRNIRKKSFPGNSGRFQNEN